MKKRDKIIISSLASFAILSGSGLLVQRTMAATTTSPTTPNLVEMITNKFNLNKTDVQTVVNQYQTEKQTARQTEITTTYTDKLTAAVTAGQLTEAQKTLLLAKQAEVQAAMQANKPDPSTMSTQTQAQKDARKTAMEKTRTDLQQWAKDNGIDSKWLTFGGGRGHGEGGPGMGGHGPNNIDLDSTTTGTSTTTN